MIELKINEPLISTLQLDIFPIVQAGLKPIDKKHVKNGIFIKWQKILTIFFISYHD